MDVTAPKYCLKIIHFLDDLLTVGLGIHRSRVTMLTSIHTFLDFFICYQVTLQSLIVLACELPVSVHGPKYYVFLLKNKNNTRRDI